MQHSQRLAFLVLNPLLASQKDLFPHLLCLLHALFFPVVVRAPTMRAINIFQPIHVVEIASADHSHIVRFGRNLQGISEWVFLP